MPYPPRSSFTPSNHIHRKRTGLREVPANRSLTEQQKRFTLIELSIVSVIIALIVGGVLVGQDLIKVAQIRATITQYNNFLTATNTFQLKIQWPTRRFECD